ncbi:hypothetical protein EDB84DRAFT_1436006 [Lactarius hengduanensis]|nr:hypothetical protein EDB84DRAFT_1436006 [Lactarius hengduanensis]
MPNWAYSWPLPFCSCGYSLRRKMLRSALPAPAPVAVIKDKSVTVSSAGCRGWVSWSADVKCRMQTKNRGRRGDRDAPIGTGDVGDAGGDTVEFGPSFGHWCYFYSLCVLCGRVHARAVSDLEINRIGGRWLLKPELRKTCALDLRMSRNDMGQCCASGPNLVFSMAPGGKEAGAWMVIGSGEEATKLADCTETGLKHEVLLDRG